MNLSFAERLRRGELLLGTIVTLQSTDVSELLSMAGYDWLFIDTEHAPLTLRDAQTLIQAARVPCLIRVADDGEGTIKRALDTGATGIVVPQVTTAGQAEQIVRHAKYPPMGTRGVGIVRAQGYGHGMREYLYQANEETVVVVQVEHKILEQMELLRHSDQCQLLVAVTVAVGHLVLCMLLLPEDQAVVQDTVM